MKKIAPVVIVIAILLIIGKIIVAGEVSDLEKDIVESVKKGGYYTALEDAKDIEFQGEKMSRKTAKLIEDVKLYGAAQAEMEKGEYAEMNLGKIKAILDEMNGSYKKYDKFKSDVEEFKEKVDSLEEYGNLGVELVEEVEALIAEGEMDEAKRRISEYKSDERYTYMPEKLKSILFDYMNEASGMFQ